VRRRLDSQPRDLFTAIKDAAYAPIGFGLSELGSRSREKLLRLFRPSMGEELSSEKFRTTDGSMLKPVFSVVIPAFNAAPFIAKAMDSVLNQKILMNFEILVVDDGSSDATAAIATGYARNVRCLRKANGGVGSARNAGVLAAEGDIILLLDADDIALPGCPQAEVDFMLAQADIDVCFGNKIRQRAADVDYLAECGLDTSGEGFVRIDNPLERLLILGDFVPTSGTCVRRRAYLAAGLQSVSRSIAEDYEFWCRIAAMDGRFAYTARPVIWYRQENQGNLMTTAYAYTGPVEAMYAILTNFSSQLSEIAYNQAHRRFLTKVETLLRYEWAYGGAGRVAQRLDSLAPLIPVRVVRKWRGLSLVPGFFARSARWALISLRIAKARTPSRQSRPASAL
jgi:glycosyltransferase involved in cell wall biosynthesis